MKYERIQPRSLRGSTERGFTILFAVLTASLLLAVGIAVFQVTLKELLLSSSARDSQFAIYAADTGIECALYWDSIGGFATGTGQQTINCASQSPVFDESPTFPATSTFTLTLLEESGTGAPCVTVDVGKYTSPTRTIIVSRGYNTCEEGSPRRVERALRVTY